MSKSRVTVASLVAATIPGGPNGEATKQWIHKSAPKLRSRTRIVSSFGAGPHFAGEKALRVVYRAFSRNRPSFSSKELEGLLKCQMGHRELFNLIRQIEQIPPCSDSGGCRQSHLLYHSPTLSVYLLEWPIKNSSTDIHSHGSSSAAISVLSGAILDVEYKPGELAQACIYGAGEIFTLEKDAIHHVECAPKSKQRAFSLHLYSPGLTHMEFYERQVGHLENLIQIGAWDYQTEMPKMCEWCGRTNRRGV